MVAAKPPSRKTANNKKKVEQADPLKIVYGVIAVCVLGLILALLPNGEDPINTTLHNFLTDAGIKRRGVAIRCPNDGCYATATGIVQRGEPLLKYPPSTIIDMRSIMETDFGAMLKKDNGTIVEKHMQESGLYEGFVNMFVYSMHLVLEKRAGSSSKFYGWIQALPAVHQMKGALFWDEERDACLDGGAAGEAKLLRKGVNAYVELAKELCENEEAVCPGGAPTLDELKWGMGTYLAHNFQDQAILPGMNFMRFDNRHDGAFPQWNEKENVLEVLAGETVKKGDEIFCTFPRGPSTQLTARGFFDKGSRGIDARIRLPDPKDEFLKKRCNDHFAELMFGANGHPREALVECIAALVATPKQRKNFRKWRSDLEHNMVTWGNVTGMAKHSVDNFREYDEETCAKQTDELGAMFYDYARFTNGILVRNYEYAIEQHKKAVEAYQRVYPPVEGETEDAPNAAEEEPEAPENP